MGKSPEQERKKGGILLGGKGSSLFITLHLQFIIDHPLFATQDPRRKAHTIQPNHKRNAACIRRPDMVSLLFICNYSGYLRMLIFPDLGSHTERFM